MFRSSLILLAIAGVVAASAQVAVFDNTKNFQHHVMNLVFPTKRDSAEMGDEVVLSGTAREVVELKLRFWYDGTKPGTFDAKIRFRNLSDDRLTPGPAITKDGKIVNYRLTNEPGAAFYEGDMIKDLPVVAGMNEYTFKIPHVKVPDRFVWTIQAYNNKDTDGHVGPAYYDPPSVGTSEDYFWQSEQGSAWIAYSWGGEPVCNFGARILAVDAKQ